MAKELRNLEQLLDRISEIVNEQDRISLGIIVETIGSRSFGPLLLLAGIILASPLSGIPGMPTAMGIFVILIISQLPLHKNGFWLPRWLLKRSVKKKKADQAIHWLRPSARFIDRWLRPRLMIFVKGVSTHLIALICIIISVFMPVMELLPFSASGAGAVLALYGLALIANDGFLALIAFVLTGIVSLLIIYSLL
ncbi:exopolysaccharide biosynthesis protein [Desulfopila inferna]|uniref:exopolysaccharide biosynthesis protein n=1 Tax=Desulfopila inferna TaxID=468528 RepID=UPI001964FC3C|nr:exopolysaccharide biosynthesis protein [Desulfopila inferna]MBM9603840.1 exopolysaccharide biosynthesis protein [Desulfopila inferna]